MRENLAIIVAVLLVFMVAGIAYQDGRRGMYPETAIIVALDYDADLVTVEDVAGNVWQFYGTEDYYVGDLVRMLMYDNGTPNSIYDDEIALAWYAGTLEQFENVLSYQENWR